MLECEVQGVELREVRELRALMEAAIGRNDLRTQRRIQWVAAQVLAQEFPPQPSPTALLELEDAVAEVESRAYSLKSSVHAAEHDVGGNGNVHARGLSPQRREGPQETDKVAAIKLCQVAAKLRRALQQPDLQQRAGPQGQASGEPEWPEGEMEEFVARECVLGRGLMVATGDLYARYATWCNHKRRDPWNKARMVGWLAGAGFEPWRTEHTRFWKGLALR